MHVCQDGFNWPINDISVSAKNRGTKIKLVLGLHTTVGEEAEICAPVFTKLLTMRKMIFGTEMHKYITI
jgi:hypothetical protein